MSVSLLVFEVPAEPFGSSEEPQDESFCSSETSAEQRAHVLLVYDGAGCKDCSRQQGAVWDICPQRTKDLEQRTEPNLYVSGRTKENQNSDVRNFLLSEFFVVPNKHQKHNNS